MSTPTPITDWLEKLGLGQYALRFVENEITLSILPDLTDADLKELGVSALGHRRLLLRAIAALDNVEKRTNLVLAETGEIRLRLRVPHHPRMCGLYNRPTASLAC
jgi:SAM domain (Sterile alpha motif)